MENALNNLQENDVSFWQGRYSSLHQRLIDTNNQFDRALATFRRVNDFFSNALRINDVADVPALVTEAVVDVFEMEFGVFYPLDSEGSSWGTPTLCGISLPPHVLDSIVTAIEGVHNASAARDARQLDLRTLKSVLPGLILGPSMYTFCVAPDSSVPALLVVGNTERGARFFTDPTGQSLDVLNLFGRQVGSLLDALHTRRRLHDKQREIERREILFDNAARAQHQAELVADLSLSPALVGGDINGLTKELAQAVCDRIGISRVGVWVAHEESGRLLNLYTCDTATGPQVEACALGGLGTVAELHELLGVQFIDSSTPGVARQEELATAGTTATLDAVIRVVGEAVGVVHFEHTTPGWTWDQRDFSFACLLADQVALCISNAHRKRAEEALEEAAVEATELARMAEAANRAKSEFLANMSHELRTPLNAILALAEGLLELARGPLTDLQTQALNIILSSGRHLLSLINDVLDIAKVEAGRLEITPEPVLAVEVCTASTTMVRALANAGQVQLESQLEDEHLSLIADPRRLKQMLVNLLVNAIKFTEPGGYARLEAFAVPEQEAVAFSVSDSGIGISPDDLGRLFTPFTQLDAGLNRSREGTGLGLMLVRRLAELHGGSVTAESKLGNGSRFTILLPSTFKAHGEEGLGSRVASTVSEDAVLSTPERAYKILLAEDNEPNINAFYSYLQSKGLHVSVARNGIEAIGRATEILPDLILMDIQMPEMDGLTATRHIRRIPQLAKVPVVALTALAMPGDRERCLEAGMNAYLTKPVSMNALMRCLSSLLESKIQ